MHPLVAWRKARKIQQGTFAKSIGVSNGYLSQIEHCMKWPAPLIMRTITEKTDNEITADVVLKNLHPGMFTAKPNALSRRRGTKGSNGSGDPARVRQTP